MCMQETVSTASVSGGVLSRAVDFRAMGVEFVGTDRDLTIESYWVLMRKEKGLGIPPAASDVPECIAPVDLPDHVWRVAWVPARSFGLALSLSRPCEPAGRIGKLRRACPGQQSGLEGIGALGG